MLLNTALAADMRMTQIKNYGFPEETQNPQTAQKPVYCDPGIMAAMLAAYNMGQTMTNAKGSRWEGGFPVLQKSACADLLRNMSGDEGGGWIWSIPGPSDGGQRTSAIEPLPKNFFSARICADGHFRYKNLAWEAERGLKNGRYCASNT